MRLPSNSGFVDPYCIGGLSLGMACFHQGRYPVSLRSGKVRVCAHLCLSFQSERKVMMLTRLAFYIRTDELHLQVESRLWHFVGATASVNGEPNKNLYAA
uniref:Uncharacterized protein n=1 Tax=Candidatus Kentrum eta TaxID=2126337 RepID=A0A450VQJ3_9GAMM|nr:MAG: hypothetical protein BECKH772B_GA0070898_102613 [Candidatus Kentron sp. H]VFK05280.1 MAG: hypothetical protein BECKH772C_GA0070978_102551 [Candidatus Kentron sp. H]VFK07036.1 MAG: hypothetical protein BECKH772A_GA0070896_106941 [Candidatus Kentron sp. H]